MDIIQALTQELQVEKWQVEAAVKLIDEGNTIPFISRYRKEATGSLNDEVLRNLHERLLYLRNLEDKKKQVLSSIEEQGKLTEELKKSILEAQTLVVVEDLYRPYRPKRRTRATIAKEKSLDQGTAAQGGEIPFTNIRRIAIPGFAETAMALNKGALLPVPFHSALGYHVIQLQDKREVPLPSFDALKPQIQNLAAQRQAQQYMADLMKNAKIAEAAPAKKKSSK